MKTRLCAVASAVIAAAVVLLTGCAVQPQAASTSNPHESATPPAAPATASRLDAIVHSGTLRVCATGDYKPYTYLRPDGRFEGIDVDLAESLAKSLGVKLQMVKTTWKTLMQDFTAGQCDMAVGGISVTLDRARRAYFSSVVMIDGKSPITRCADVRKYRGGIARLNQPSVRVIFNPGGTNERFAREHLPNAHLIEYPDNVTIFEQIAQGKADVMVTDTSETLLQHKLHPALCPVEPGKPLQYGEKAYLLPLGDNVFKAYVDEWLHLAKATGQYQAVVDKWLK